ncbi:MAG: 23S rRNA (adenine(2503)-C(2))-methyltransferase RlmN [Bacteroidales bacterium]|nr:23S rRNA (adenine(2503)-C(2))-methyltransferase RlmN [Bacteroidales bacterium]
MSGKEILDIRSVTREELENFFLQHGEKKFRAGQAYDWLWKKSCQSFNAMTTLSKEARQLLASQFSFNTASVAIKQQSSDGTIKVAFGLHDGFQVEGVMIPSGDRATACISSQVGCSLGCNFCATGKLGFTRNLTTGEIVDQVVHLSNLAPHLSNIVFMGMGEPFLNYEAVKMAIEKITATDGLAMSPQRITVSSIGIPKMIRKMTDDGAKFHFALSLHAANDKKREKIIPFHRNYSLTEIIDALKYYYAHSHKRLTIEYILLGKFNDTIADAKELAVFCKNFPVKINIIEYNPVKETGFIKSDPEDEKAFVNFLEKRNMVVNVRKSRGQDIDAACGQLACHSRNKQLINIL